MSYVNDTDIFSATNNGLEVILAYYPNAAKVVHKSAKTFKIRESEKTASASLKQLANGIWVVTDFGGDQVSRNGIQVCMHEEGITYGEACSLLGARYGIKGAVMAMAKPVVEKRALKPEEQPKTYSFEYNDELSEKELSILGPRVNNEHCMDFNLKSCKSFTHCKENEAVVTTATEDYPILVFDYEDWQKIYQPNSFEKAFRFRYAGKKPERHLFGLKTLRAAFEKNKAKVEDDDQTFVDADGEQIKVDRKKDPRIDRCFIVSGGSDGINLRSFGEYPLWFNSESERLNWEEFKLLKTYAKEIYYIADLDSTGVKQAVKLGLEFLEIRLLWLPDALRKYNDKRGNPRKDFKDYVEVFYRNEEQKKTFSKKLEKLIENALPMQFWTSHNKDGKVSYNISNTRLYHFLKLNGFGRYESAATKDGYFFVRTEGNIVRVLRPDQIENFVHGFLEERGMPTELRDYVYRSPQLSEKSMSKLPKLEIDFTSADKSRQFWFFQKSIWEITGQDIVEHRQGDVDNFVWEDKVIELNPKKSDAPFSIYADESGNLDIDIFDKDCWFLNYLVNSSRVHWRKELEESFEGRPEKEAQAYFEANRFNIAGANLSDDEVYEQKLHLINKIYSIGYLLHQYKDESKAWCVFAMDNKISEVGQSHGGSGKSLCYGYLNYILKRRFYLKGRDPNLTKNDFIYHGVTEDTDYIFIDDATQYLQFDFFFSEITGSLKVNPKNAQPFEIPFQNAPKFVITSNFTLTNFDPSTARRLLITVFSDYYHYNSEGEYREVRQVSDDFRGKNLYRDFDADQWNKYVNFLAYALKFFLSHPHKINPPMGNVKKRSLMAEMGDPFFGWATAFFAEQVDGKYTRLDTYISREAAFEECLKSTKVKWTPYKFKRAMAAYCEWCGYNFNPKEHHNNGQRILRSIEGKTQEVFFIETESMKNIQANFETVDPGEIEPPF